MTPTIGMIEGMAVSCAPGRRAASRFVISKEAIGKADRVATRVAPLAAKPRREEIARRLAGAAITEQARAAAARLLEAAVR
jgi:DNA repair protein RecN (Recombination protein N)